MKYQEQVDTMLAHMAANFSRPQMLDLIKALGQGIAKTAALIQVDETRNDLLTRTHTAICSDTDMVATRYLIHVVKHGLNETTVPVFLDSLRSPRRVEHG